jgi:energy-coupling factor transport system ATP-binding protein
MFLALPTPMRVWAAVQNDLPCPLTVREGRLWLDSIAGVGKTSAAASSPEPERPSEPAGTPPVVRFQDVWFKYDKNLPVVLKGLSLDIPAGNLFCVVGGNGTGKTTALSVIAGLRAPYRGKVLIKGREAGKVANARVAMLPQNPETLFVKKTVALDLAEMLEDSRLSQAEKSERIQQIVSLCELDPLLSKHPYDLSGGEQQRAGLSKVLLRNPEILLLDEPTKGLDAFFKEKLASILKKLTRSGVTVVMVSHDVEFCAKHADRLALLFDGAIVTENAPRAFFAGNSFYTTAANRMARGLFPAAVTAEDVIEACKTAR